MQRLPSPLRQVTLGAIRVTHAGVYEPSSICSERVRIVQIDPVLGDLNGLIYHVWTLFFFLALSSISVLLMLMALPFVCAVAGVAASNGVRSCTVQDCYLAHTYYILVRHSVQYQC